MMAVAALFMPLLFSCSGGSSSKNNLLGAIPDQYAQFVEEKAQIKEEAKNSELKNVLGYDRALSYGLSCMEMQGALTIFAANVKRIIKLKQNA